MYILYIRLCDQSSHIAGYVLWPSGNGIRGSTKSVASNSATKLPWGPIGQMDLDTNKPNHIAIMLFYTQVAVT